MWRWMLGNPAFGDDMMVKDRIIPAFNMRSGDDRHWRSSESSRGEK
jgi:hypothetical protein